MDLYIKPALEEALRKSGNSISTLSEAIGVSRTAIVNWQDGGIPRVDAYAKLLKYIGGDLEKAQPSYEPAERDTLTVLGDIAAGTVMLMEEKVETVPGLRSIWKESRYASKVQGEIRYCRVSGDSMEPGVPDGSYLAIGRPATGQIDDFTPVIARIGEDATFKLWQKYTDIRGNTLVYLFPINYHNHNIQSYDPDDVLIEFIVLGVLNPWREGFGPGNTGLNSNGPYRTPSGSFRES